MRRGKWIFAAAAVALCGAWVIWPYWAFHSFQQAIRDKDTAELSRLADWRSIQEGIRADLKTTFIAEMNSDPKMKDNPFSGFALMLGSAMVDKMVESMITPSGIVALIHDKSNGDSKNDGDTDGAGLFQNVNSAFFYGSPTRFRIVVGQPPEILTQIYMKWDWGWYIDRIALPIDLLTKHKVADEKNLTPPTQPKSTGTDNLKVDPRTASSLKPINLPDLIYLLLPDRGAPNIGWAGPRDAPIRWITDGIGTSWKGDAQRVGLARVRTGGQISTVLHENTEELAWSVVLSSNAAPKFGPKEIRIEPGTPDEQCFGSAFDGCNFSVEQAISSSDFISEKVCEFKGDGGFPTVVLRVTADGKEPQLLVIIKDGGSGGETTSIEIHPLDDQQSVCHPS